MKTNPDDLVYQSGFVTKPDGVRVRAEVCHASPGWISTGFGTFQEIDGVWRWIVDARYVFRFDCSNNP